MATADQPSITRRALFGAIAAIPALAAMRPLAADPVPAEWRELIREVGFVHPNGAAAVLRAYRAGVDPANLVSVQVDSDNPADPLPVLTFLLGGGHKVLVSPTGVAEARSFR